MATAMSTGMQFFVLRVASNKEDRVREALMRKVKIEGLEAVVGRILVPTERVRSIKDGKRRDTDRKLYPGYVFIELELDKKGDKIKVTNGAFQNFEGEVEEIIPDKGMVRIITTIFGRPTPLELEYWQIEKM